MSIRTIQIQRAMEDAVRALYSTGVKPTANEVLTQVSNYFTQFPAGNPLPITGSFMTPNGRSDVAAINQIMVHAILNIDVAYEAAHEQIQTMLELASTLRSRLDRLAGKRDRIATLIDDHLLSSFNTDGYYYSIGDQFSDTLNVDLGLTSAFVDTAQRAVSIPTANSLTNIVPGNFVTLSSLQAKVGPQVTAEGLPVQIAAQFGASVKNAVTLESSQGISAFRTISEFNGAVDGLSNTFWGIEMSSPTPGEAICRFGLTIGNTNNPVTLSRIDFTPHGISPVQVFTEVGQTSQGSLTYTSFGDFVQKGINKMSFVGPVTDADTIRITLRKTEHDYVDQTGGTTSYRFIFGATEIAISESVYDNSATFVSQELMIDPDYNADAIIDAVSLVVDDTTPPDTSIKYYVANDPGADSETLDSFAWRSIAPVGTSDNNQETVIRFNGVQQFVRNISDDPHNDDLARIPPNNTDPDLTQRNPSPAIIPGVDVYRICQFAEDTFTNSLVLDEGINTTRIWYTNGPAVDLGLGYWSNLINSSQPPQQKFGRIDTGHGFFDGNDIGESEKTIYAETFVDVLEDMPPYISDFIKVPPNATTWNVDVYLNGQVVGHLPVGTDHLLIPWRFRQGLNHIAVTVDIPLPTPAVPNPYNGHVQLFSSGNLMNVGIVKLATWNYVSLFDLQYNQTGQPTTFSIYNGEIITRRPPPTTFRLEYGKSTQVGPEGVRVRADLSRENNNPHVTPRLNSYRLRFSYGTQSS